MARWFVAAVLILVIGATWTYASRVPLEQQPRNLPPQPAVGHPAPNFTLTTLAGEHFVLEQQRGRPLVLNFWATWCGPCQNELPALQAAAERYDGSVQIIGVDQAESAATVQEFVDRMGLTFPIPMDVEQDVAQRYNVKGLPTTFFIDSAGIIRHLWMGEMNSITLAEGIAKVMESE